MEFFQKKLIPVDENGSLIGENHQNAKLSDEDVDYIRDLHEEGIFGYRAIAKLFGVSRNTIKDICKYRRRGCTPDRYKPVYFDENGKRVVHLPGGVRDGEKL